MSAVTIDLPEHFLTVAREAAATEGVSLETWCSKALLRQMLHLAAVEEAEWERAHPEARAAFYAEREAEHEAMFADQERRWLGEGLQP